MPRRERPAVAIAVDVKDHWTIRTAAAQEVSVQRMWHPLGRNGRACGTERLRRDLPAVKRQAFTRAALVLAAEQIAVELLELEQGCEIRLRHTFAFLAHVLPRRGFPHPTRARDRRTAEPPPRRAAPRG